MRRTLTTALLTILVLAFTQGCRTLTKAEQEQAEKNRRQAVELLNSFADAVANDDVESAGDCLAPGVSPSKRSRLERRIAIATWLELYTGYELEAQKAAAWTDADEWLEREVRLWVPAANRQGVEFEDGFTLAPTQGGEWGMVDFSLQEPLVGEAVDLPEEDREKVKALVGWVIEQLQGDAPERVLGRLPQTDSAQLRPVTRTWWEWLTGARPQTRWIHDDLSRMMEFHILHWPDPDQSLPVAYVGEGQVMVFYDIPYVWPQGGITRTDELRVEMFLRRGLKGWKLDLLRLYGKGIPGSQ